MSRATRGVVAAGDPQTAEAGAHALREGGNATDAAVAAGLAAFMSELPLASPLGGGVMVAWKANEAPIALDFFTRTPGLGGEPPAERDFRHEEVDFGATTQIFHVGRASAAVPLALPGLLEAHRRWGRLPLTVVAEPAVALGRNGYVLGERIAYVYYLLESIVSISPGCKKLYFDGERIAQAGARMTNPDLADTLQQIAAAPQRIEQLYAQLAREFAPARGGLITSADVEKLEVMAAKPVSVEHAGLSLASMPPPSSTGVLVALGLKLLEGIGKEERFLSAGHMLRLAKVQDALLDLRDDEFDARCWDPGFVAGLLAPEHVEKLRSSLGKPLGAGADNLLGSTTQISVSSRR